MGCIDLVQCVLVLRCGLAGVVWCLYAGWGTSAFIISLFNTQHTSDVNTSILRSLRFICWVISWVILIWFDVCWCYVVVWLWWCGIRMQAEVLVPLLFLYLILNLFRMLIHPSSGACDLFVELSHGLYCSGSMCGVVSVCSLHTIPHHHSQTTT